MPKKSKRKLRPHPKNFLLQIRIMHLLPILIIVSIVLVVVIQKNLINQPFCANAYSCISDLSGIYDQNSQIGIFMGQKVSAPGESLYAETNPTILGDTTASKKIYVDLSAQQLYAFEGGNMVYQFPVSTGKWGKTPTGTFKIWVKLRYTRMVGGNPAIGTYYNLPNVPYTMFYYNDQTPKAQGYSIHGAYWHNNFGHPMSHGCVNMRISDSEKLFVWASPTTVSYTTYASAEDPGTEIIVYGTAPRE